MNRIFKYYKNCKGITLVLMALMLAVLLMLAGLAIDIAYMYYVKNQLQVAADAAALAGAAKLDGCLDNGNTTSLCPTLPHYSQIDARQEAWKFACKNSAAGQNVYLVNGEITDGDGKVIGLRSCADADMPDNLNNGNSTNGDIVVGHWRSTTPPSGVTCEPAGSGYFCPATGNTGLDINAIKTRPRRSGTIENPDTPGMPQVRVFIGQIFKIIKADWSFMSARASAIASGPPLQRGPFPICFRSCGTVTPLTITGQNLTPGTRFILKNQKGTPNIGWTTFLDSNTSKSNIEDYLRGIKTPPDVCHQCIFTTQGVVGPSPCVVREMIRQKGANHDVNGVTIFGWKVLIPILPDTPCPSAKGTGCFDDPGYQPGDPYQVTQYALAIITDAVPQGNCPHDPGPLAGGESGIVIVGFGPGASGTSTIKCLDCSDPVWNTLVEPPKLVK